MELETKITLWLSAEEAKALDTWEKNLDPNQTSGTPLDVRQKIIDTVLENINRQWDIDECYKEAIKSEMPTCEMCEEDVEYSNDDSGMELCSDCFSDAGYGGC